MKDTVEKAPFLALIDDDEQSARVLTRTLVAHGAPAPRWYGGAVEGRQRLHSVLSDPAGPVPGLVIVDLKSHSAANAEFLRSVNPLAGQAGMLMVAMSQCDKPATRAALLEAGATTVFIRHAELGAYRREAASLVKFWARSLRPETVGM